jgi:hypothetical protein
VLDGSPGNGRTQCNADGKSVPDLPEPFGIPCGSCAPLVG